MSFACKGTSLLLGALLATAGFAAHAPRLMGDLQHENDYVEAITALRHDPNLARQQQHIRTLRWKSDAAAAGPPTPATSGWLARVQQLLAKGVQLLVWLAGAVAVALALVWVLRLVRRRAPRAASVTTRAPSAQIRDLDVRPGSLPADIGAAAAALLTAGQMREALSLLYRGALSRAIHVHGIPLGESFTEGDVLSAVAPRLGPPGAEYVGRLVTLRQRAVYAAEAPSVEAVAALCHDFPQLDAGVA